MMAGSLEPREALIVVAQLAALAAIDWLGNTRHLALFFIPIAVGLRACGRLARTHGVAILATLILSASIGILLGGGIVAGIRRRRGGRP